jgi:hypothetical protein
MSFSFAQAQSGKGREHHRQIQAQKVSYMTQVLDLSPEEAQKFWPLFNECQKKEQNVEMKKRSIHRSCKKKSKQRCSDKEILVKCDSILLLDKELIDLRIEYFNKYKKILPARKVHRLLIIEREFNQKLLRRIGKNRGKGRKSH